ncbi:MAG TPA: amino acid adenylation domain-containing protein [Flavisolibacter sp.]|jgi:amino acid adenylation domain-containing protein|nr:amino acid adenylation domain-containing protein [Flavisolibacter sp.]
MKPLRLDKGAKNQLLAIAARNNCDLPAVLLATLQIVYHLSFERSKPCVGYRNNSYSFSNSNAVSSNLTPVCTDFQEKTTFPELLQHTIKNILDKEYDTQSAWTDIFLFQKANGAEGVERRATISSPEWTSMMPTLQRVIIVTSNEDEVVINLESVASSKDFLPAEIILGRYREALLSVMAAPEQRVDMITILSEKERDLLVEGFNNSIVSYPSRVTILDVFEAHVENKPEAIALVSENEQITYTELHHRSNTITCLLKTKGIKAGSMIPLYLDRGIALMAGLLGILKAGCAYVPIDPDMPLERLLDVLKDCSAPAILIGNTQENTLPGWIAEKSPTTQLLNIETNLLVPEHAETTAPPILPEALAYVIYTSGSTGKPKGVMVQHRSLMDYLYGLEKAVHLSECRSLAVVSTIAADLGNTVIFGALFTGATLHIISKERASSPTGMQAYFKTHTVDCIKIVPSHWQALCMGNELLLPKKKIIFGGEALSLEIVKQIQSSDTPCQVINHYGPSETTIGKLLHIVRPYTDYSGQIPLGKPFSNTQVYVLNQHQDLCPIGVAGELYIGGEGVSRGYLNREDLTAERFVPDPFHPEKNRTLYKTGDLARWLPDGNIEFLGRIDDQVKIRGYRVEPGEVQSALSQHPAVSQCIVLAKANKAGDKHLVAYIVPASEFEVASLTQYLQEKLPGYMIPSRMVSLHSLPLTSNG